MGLISKFAYYNKVKRYGLKYSYTLKDPTFIVGCGHSGTSILLSILSNHHNFFTIYPESYIFHKNEVQRSKLLRLWVHNSYLNNKKLILEKTPSHCLKINKILNTFSKPKIIAIVRDGRDVSCSLKNRNIHFKQGLNRWVSENLEIIKYFNSDFLLIIRYEDFVKRPSDIIKRIACFIGEEIDMNIVNNTVYGKKNFHPGDSDHARKRNQQTNENIKDCSGIWINGLSITEKNLFNNNSNAQFLSKFFNYI